VIYKLTLRNFQSHEDTTLEFSRGINVIVGSSDVGKTAILRALRWLTWNRPQGHAFVSTWGGPTAVVIETAEGDKVERVKDESDRYIVGKTPLAAIRTDVPEEVFKTLNMSELNFQSQFDQPFLLTDSSGAVAQHFNSIAHLDAIDLGLKNIQQQIRQLDASIVSGSARAVDLEKQLSGYDYLKDMETDVTLVEGMEKQRVALMVSWSRLDTALYELKAVDAEIADQQVLLDLSDSVDLTFDLMKQRDEVKAKCASLNNTLNALEETETVIDSQQKLVDLSDSVSSTLDSIKQHKETETRWAALCDSVLRINRLDEQVEDLNKLVDLEFDVGSLLQLVESGRNSNTRLGALKTLLDEVDDNNRQSKATLEMQNRFEKIFHDNMAVCPLCGKSQ
jgi:DNA repair exonuclease SbcCD ATPase subunit